MNVLVFVGVFVITCTSQFQPTPLKSVTLNPSNTAQDGASISTTQTGEITTNTQWNINSVGSDSWHIVTSLDNSWGFHSSKQSIITFQINSPTLPTSTFDDLLYAFTVPNSNKFIGMRSRMDGNANRIVPDTGGTCPTSGSTALTTGNVVTLVQNGDGSTRATDLGLSFGTYDNLVSIQSGTHSFPIRITLINKPASNQLDFIYESVSGGLKEKCVYEAFGTNQGLQIYFAINKANEQCSVTSIDITYSYDLTYPPTSGDSKTSNPTTSPTKNPTKSPIKNPTISPIKNPTISPIKNPTISPIKNPTISPSKNPTKSPVKNPTKSPIKNPSVSPTKYPSSIPTKYPTHNPSKSPTKLPTQIPSLIPTMPPSKSPTMLPTNQPSNTPTDLPTVTPTTSSPSIIIYIPQQTIADESSVDGEVNDVSTTVSAHEDMDNLHHEQYTEQTSFFFYNKFSYMIIGALSSVIIVCCIVFMYRIIKHSFRKSPKVDTMNKYALDSMNITCNEKSNTIEMTSPASLHSVPTPNISTTGNFQRVMSGTVMSVTNTNGMLGSIGYNGMDAINIVNSSEEVDDDDDDDDLIIGHETIVGISDNEVDQDLDLTETIQDDTGTGEEYDNADDHDLIVGIETLGGVDTIVNDVHEEIINNVENDEIIIGNDEFMIGTETIGMNED